LLESNGLALVSDELQPSVLLGRVLIVEDDAAVALYLEQSLEELGYDVIDVVTTEPEAMLRLTRDRPDLVVTDIRLRHGGDGLKVAKAAHDLFGTPAVVITGASDGETYLRAEASGAVAYLRKPFGMSQLRTILTTLEIRGA
jgi:CheY-like chemotaxis protein